LLPWVWGLQLAQERQAKLQFAPSDAVQCRKPFEEPWMLVEKKKARIGFRCSVLYLTACSGLPAASVNVIGQEDLVTVRHNSYF
jgi:hypothetical protein